MLKLSRVREITLLIYILIELITNNKLLAPNGDKLGKPSSDGIVSKISKSLKSLLDGYNSLLEKYPYRTKFISSGIVGEEG